jgi:uncharacterized membrane protein
MRHRFLPLIAALLLLAVAAPAHASPGQVISDCAADGDLDRQYSRQDLQGAQNGLPSDLDEYSNCREVIAGATPLSTRRKRSGSGPGGGATAKNAPGKRSAASKRRAKAKDTAALDRATEGGKPSLRIGGQAVEPGSNGLFKLASAANGLPLSLLLALIAIGLLALGSTLYVLRRRFPALASLPLSKIPLSRVRLPRFRR